VPSGIYEAIYRHADQLAGYNRYSRYASLMRKSVDPMQTLAEAEDVYWFVSDYLEKRVSDKNSKILEVGSGLGYLTYAIASKGYSIQGMDVSTTAVESAKKSFGDLYFCDDLFEYSKKQPGVYDVVIMTEVIEHVPDPCMFIKALRALLKPNGVILLTTPNKTISQDDAIWKTESPPVHLWWFSESSVRQMAIKIGMNLELWNFSEFNERKVLGAAVSATRNISAKPFLNENGEPLVVNLISPPSYLRRVQESRIAKQYLTALFEWLHRLRETKPFWRKGIHLITSRSATMGIVLTSPTVVSVPNVENEC
jgi:SAM-dependent methyltransferase